MNGIIIIDKPAGWTSMDVCAKLRGILHEKRVGHGGTLDPMATGVLPVFVGRATRAVEFCENAAKRYTCGIRFGIVTDTQDITGKILSERGHSVSETDLLSLLPHFLGTQEQIPPMYSAVKIGGKKLYELARQGKSVERKARRIEISSISLAGRENGDYLLDVVCSKGTYIRTLCADIGTKAGCGAAMSYLRRTGAGAFRLCDALSLDEVIIAAQHGDTSRFLRPVDSLFSECPSIVICGESLRRCKNGNAFSHEGAPDGLLRVYSENGNFLMLGRSDSGMVSTVKSFFDPA